MAGRIAVNACAVELPVGDGPGAWRGVERGGAERGADAPIFNQGDTWAKTSILVGGTHRVKPKRNESRNHGAKAGLWLKYIDPCSLHPSHCKQFTTWRGNLFRGHGRTSAKI